MPENTGTERKCEHERAREYFFNFDRNVSPVIPGKTEKMGHFFSSDPESTVAKSENVPFSFDRNVSPVIPGKTEKMGHFFSFDPESTAA
ncbi:hypothetical protein QUF72_14600 [Desulfobacterales bacterium HSG2]|nr:hypothetical protein [Desulfobacterales bacterium HSG2]